MTSDRVASRQTTVLILAGGTGGHVYPALAVAERLREDGCYVAWMGTRAGLEARVVPKARIALYYIPVSGLRSTGAMRWIKAPFMLAAALLRAVSVILRCRPQVVLGMGGYAAGQGGLAAWLLRRPLLIHEQNSVPGLTNRLLARLATGVMEAFPSAFASRYHASHTGNPVRACILAVPAPEVRLANRRGSLRLLVLGGSQGAAVLNKTVPEALAALSDRRAVEVRHQVGPAELEQTRVSYACSGVKSWLGAFIDDMADAYSWADLVVCRAGAMTVCELATVGLASILVPFPHAVDDHQTGNARYLADAGAAVVVQQVDLNPSLLCRMLSDFCRARERLVEMAKSARKLAIPDATHRVARRCMEAAGV